MKTNKIKVGIVLLVVALFFVSGCLSEDSTDLTGSTIADIKDNPDKVTIYFFWGDGCPHCAEEKPFLEEMQDKYSDIEVKMFETWKNKDNAKLFSVFAEAYGTRAQGVPTTFIDDKVWVGYADYMGEEMEAKIKYCLENECVNPGDKVNSGGN